LHSEPGVYEFRGNGQKGNTFLAGSGPGEALPNERKWQLACTDLFEWLGRLQVLYPTLIRVDLNGMEALVARDLRTYVRNLIMTGYPKVYSFYIYFCFLLVSSSIYFFWLTPGLPALLSPFSWSRAADHHFHDKSRELDSPCNEAHHGARDPVQLRV
jgi:hypothetical protein